MKASFSLRLRRLPASLLVALVACLLALSATGCEGCPPRSAGKPGAAPSSSAVPLGAAEPACPPGTMAAHGSVRQAVFAAEGWYPAERATLGREVTELLDQAPAWTGARPLALISPHAGYRYSAATAAAGYRALRGQSYRRVFLLGPSHRMAIRGIAVSADAFFASPLGQVPVDRAASAALAAAAPFQGDPRAHRREHSLEVQLPLLQGAIRGPFALVPLVMGELSRAELSQASAALRAAMGPEDLLVASSDFTHYGASYGYEPFRDDVPRRLDELANDAWAQIEARDVEAFLAHKEKTGDTICGWMPIAILLGALPADARATRVKVDSSGKMSGDWSSSVTYQSIVLTGSAWQGKPAPDGAPAGCEPAPTGGPLGEESRRTAREIARRAVDGWVRSKERFDPVGAGLAVSDELRRPLGVFVTLKKQGELRGCIGNIVPEEALYLAIVGRAIDAAANDSRFEPVTPAELPELELEISVLTEPKPITGPGDIVLGRDGVILRKRGRSAVFLPQVAPEQGWTVEQMLGHLSRKAGLGADDWRDGASFESFQALVF